MYSEKLEKLINIALADGVLTEKKKQILFKNAEAEGIDLDEFEMVLDTRLQERQKNKIETHENSAPTIQNLLIQLSNVDSKKENKKDSGLVGMVGKVVDGVMSGSIAGSIVGAIGGMIVDGSIKEKDITTKKNIISNYPIPTTKNDVLEFLSYAVPMAKKKGNFFTSDNYEMHNEFASVWKTKCEQIITKVRLSMQNDNELMTNIILYAQELGLKIKR